MRGVRIARLENQLREEIAMIILQELKDHRLGFVTITHVRLSNDIRSARVAFTCLGDEQERLKSHKALKSSASYIHGLIRKRLRLKVIPKIFFEYDDSINDSIAMEKILDKLKQESSDKNSAS